MEGIELSAKEYVIEGLQRDTVRVFAEKWYAALNKVSGHKKLDVEKDFLVPLYKNSNVKNLISNPLELTSLLMISSYDSYLPSDYAKIYGRSIELWLTWTNNARYNFEDVMRQLSQIAYKMATSEKEKIVVSRTVFILKSSHFSISFNSNDARSVFCCKLAPKIKFILSILSSKRST